MSHALLSPSAAQPVVSLYPSTPAGGRTADSTSEYAAEGTLAHKVSELLARKKFTISSPRPITPPCASSKRRPLWNDEMQPPPTHT
jgi:hypothetical protein